jgi:hypothetical protein
VPTPLRGLSRLWPSIGASSRPLPKASTGWRATSVKCGRRSSSRAPRPSKRPAETEMSRGSAERSRTRTHTSSPARPEGSSRERRACDVGLEQIFRTARQHGKNDRDRRPSSPALRPIRRLAHSLGILMTTNTGADVPDQPETIQLGLAPARRTRVEKSEVVDTCSARKFLAWAGNSRARGR